MVEDAILIGCVFLVMAVFCYYLLGLDNRKEPTTNEHLQPPQRDAFSRPAPPTQRLPIAGHASTLAAVQPRADDTDYITPIVLGYAAGLFDSPQHDHSSPHLDTSHAESWSSSGSDFGSSDSGSFGE